MPRMRSLKVHPKDLALRIPVYVGTTKSAGLFGKTHGGDDACRAAGTLLIHFAMPFDELLCEIPWIVEAAHFEEGRFYEAHQVLDSSFLLRTMRPTQFHPMKFGREQRFGEAVCPGKVGMFSRR